MYLGIFGKESVVSETALISINKVLSICQRSQKPQTVQAEALDSFWKLPSVELTGFVH